MHRPVRLRFEAGFVVASVATLLLYKAYVAWPRQLPGALVGLLVEACLLWLTFLLAARLAARSTLLARLLFYPLAYTLVMCSASHAYFFESAAERRFSLIEVGPAGILYFFTHVLPASGFAVLGGVFLLAHVGAFLLRDGMRLPGLSRVTLALLALSSVGLVAIPRAPSPVVDAGVDVVEKLTTPSVLPLLGKPRFSPTQLDRSKTPPELLAGPTPFKKVLVLVMETMTAASFEQERQSLPRDTFVNGALDHVHRFERYFPNNQDSRTGMLGMLGSRFIPHDAYTEEGRDKYMFLSERSSLVSEMQALGYDTAFAVSQHEIELVVGDLPWQHRIHLDDQKLSAARERGLLCFVPYEFEHSCEDKALLPEVEAFLDSHERAFLYQEFIWGHASAYNEASGKSNAEYYSSYVDALIAHLREQGTLDETLVVLSSDHGFRDTSMQDQLSVYRIPLWFYATRFAAERDDRLFSHLDFKNLLHRERALSVPAIEESPFVMIYGPTSASFLAVLTREHDFTLLKLRGDSAYVMRHDRLDASGGFAGAARDAAGPASFLRLFDDYRAYFARQ